MNSVLSEDRISSLPDNVIEEILTRLPLRDAGRTSILSSAWRYKWNTLQHLEFCWSDFSLPSDQSKSQYDRKLTEAVDQVLLLHQGPIRIFKFHTYLDSCKGIDRWISFLSRNGIRELNFCKFNGPFYKVPSSLFSCEEITELGLYRCTLRNPPAKFDGFRNLRTLALLSVDFTDNNGLGNLISNSPYLYRLQLRSIGGCTHLKVCAPNLVVIEVESALEDLCFERTPALANVTINLSTLRENQSFGVGAECRLTQFLTCLPSIKTLRLLSNTYQVLLSSACVVPLKLPTICQLLHFSARVNFEDMQHVLAALCIFRSSPFLQKVYITSISKEREGKSVEKFWEAQEVLHCFCGLQILNLTGFKGTTSELKFVEIVLANAPVLEIVKIEVNQVLPITDVLKISRKLVRFRRISSKVKIVIPE